MLKIYKMNLCPKHLVKFEHLVNLSKVIIADCGRSIQSRPCRTLRLVLQSRMED